MDKAKLAQKIETVSKELADITRSERSKIEQIDTPFLKNGLIFRIIHLGEYRPMGFTVGVAEPEFTVLLPLNPKGFSDLMEKGGFTELHSSESHLQYALVFLETTGSFSENFRIIEKFEDIELIPKPTEDEEKRYGELNDKYSSIIKAPKISDNIVTVYAIKQRNLVKITINVSSAGEIEKLESVMEENLPIAYTN